MLDSARQSPQHTDNSEHPIATLPKPVLAAAKVLVTGGLLTWIVSRVDVESMRGVLAQADAWLIVYAVGALALALGVTGLRWWLLYRHLDSSIRPGELLGAFWLGLCCNQLMPTAVGGDVIRTAYLAARQHSLDHLICSAMVDRFSGMMSTAILAAAGLAFAPVALPFEALRWLPAVFVALGITGFVALTSSPVRRLVDRQQEGRSHGKIVRFLLGLLHQLTSYGGAWRLISFSIFVSVFGQLMVVSAYALLGSALHLDLGFRAYLFLVPIMLFVSNLPISVGGIGVRETSVVALLGLMGVPEQSAIGVSLLFLASFLLLTLPGGLTLLLDRRSVRQQAQRSPAAPPS